MNGTINTNRDVITTLPSGIKYTIPRNQLNTCTDAELQQAMATASDSNNIQQLISNINAEITAIKNSGLAPLTGNQPEEWGGGTIVDLGGPVGRDGLTYGRIDESVVSKSGNAEVIGNPAALARATESIKNTDKPKIFEYKTSANTMIQECLSGSDLSVFYIVELPAVEDIMAGVAPEYARKEVVMMEFDSVLSISYSTIREEFPVRSLGYANPRAITKGIRTISGHVAFNIFAEDVLSRLRGRVTLELEKKRRNVYGEGKTVQDAISNLAHNNNALNNDGELYKLTPLADENYKTMLLDQLPPFHLLVMGVNEHGVMSRMLIKDVSIIDENQYQGTQQPNIVNRVSFVALDLVPMTARQYDSTIITQSLSSMEEGFVGGNWNYSMRDMSATSILTEVTSDTIERGTKRDWDYSGDNRRR